MIGDNQNLGSEEFRVPSTEGKSELRRRSPTALHGLIQNAMARREYEKSIVLFISIAEDYLVSHARLISRAYPERLPGKIKIEFSELVKHGAEKIIEDEIRERLQRIIYASPAEYLAHISSILRKGLPPEAMQRFSEAKASRDIIVHAQSIVNERYVEKAGTLARAQVGERLPIDLTYFNSVVGTIKDVYASIYDAVITEFGNDERVRGVLATKGL